MGVIKGNTTQVFEEERPMRIHIDKFNDSSCRAGGEHQWFGEGVVYYQEDGKPKEMSQRKYNLLSDKMKKDLQLTGGECTCNKCGIKYSQAFNPYTM